MKSRKVQLDRLERTLLGARRKPRSMQASDEWNEYVMTDIRKLGPLTVQEKDQSASLTDMAWRFTAAAGLAAAALLVYNLVLGFIDYGELAARFLVDPSMFII